MRKLMWAFAALAIAVTGFVVVGAAPAFAAAPTYCHQADGNRGLWYVHAPYPINGQMHSWVTCTPTTTSIPWPDSGGNGLTIGIERIELQYSYSGSYYNTYAIAYLNGGWYTPWMDSAHAVTGACQTGAWYRTTFLYLYAGNWYWGTTDPVRRC